ncbi:cohesin domain-containing protein [uncultured Eubacterium sp.]|uniref:cohesin domain-containing protein n=1 Tax=uncultured Eubacterium sp. TaxID=165185 RepID=UPI0025986B65|nr:cohesin domain-containing protein [uncultured Eubacterium sp.]
MKTKKRKVLGIVICIIAVVCGVMGIRTHMDKNTEQDTSWLEQIAQDGIPTVAVSNTDAKAGQKVKVPVYVVSNPGILGMTLSLSYDESIMQLVNVQEGEAFKDVLDMNYSKQLKSGCTFLWDGEDITTDQILDGKILILEFKILKSAPVGKSPIVLLCDTDGVVDRDIQPIDLRLENGSVTIRD